MKARADTVRTGRPAVTPPVLTPSTPTASTEPATVTTSTTPAAIDGVDRDGSRSSIGLLQMTPSLSSSSSSSSSLVATALRPEAAWSAEARRIASEVLAGLPPGDRPARVQAAMTALLQLPALQQADVSCVVADTSGKTLFDHRGAIPTNPCSNTKLVTAGFALSVLGPGHRFKTTVVRVDDDTVAVQGRFDPTMTRAQIDTIARDLAGQGVREIPRLLLDVSAMQGSNVPASFAKYGDEDWEYLARPEPLSVDKNVVKLTVKPGVDGVVVVVADSGAWAVRANVQQVPAGSPFKVACNESDPGGVLERIDGRAVLDVWGTVAADYHKGKTLVMKAPAPLEQVAFAWQDAFTKAGIAVGVVDVSDQATTGATLHEHRSKPLATILRTSLATSNAFDHEMLALAAASAQRGGPVSLPETAQALTTYLHSLGGEGEVVNGSGIGNDTRVSAASIAKILVQAQSDPRLHPLLESLARPGQTGTLKGRLLDSGAEARFAGKTGTGEGAVALSGVTGDVVTSLLVEHMRSRRDDVRAALDATAIVLSALQDV